MTDRYTIILCLVGSMLVMMMGYVTIMQRELNSHALMCMHNVNSFVINTDELARRSEW